MLSRTSGNNIIVATRNYSPKQAGMDALSRLDEKEADSEEEEVQEFSPVIGDDDDEVVDFEETDEWILKN